MGKESQYFYLSGFLSLSLFSFFISLFIYGLFSELEVKNYALKKENFVSISLQSIDVPISSPKKTEATPIKKEEPTPVQKPVEPIKETPKKDINLDSLFSSVVTKDIKKEIKQPEKKPDKRLADNLSAKPKTKSEDSAKSSLSSMVDSITSDKKSDTTQKTSGGNEVNEYLAKIQAIVYDNFFPPSATEGLVVKVAVEINALGRVVSFRVVSYSNHDGLNHEVDRIESRLKSIIFPQNPNGKSQTHYINLISKD
ncbi:MAG: TonB C-terminal domain-containing protein [Sulfurimonadaceae bacterium]|jgi:protein TonB|nr:TonB C-terminal domain-containing protein [Sulfurimonadaceae bacterium]